MSVWGFRKLVQEPEDILLNFSGCGELWGPHALPWVMCINGTPPQSLSCWSQPINCVLFAISVTIIIFIEITWPLVVFDLLPFFQKAIPLLMVKSADASSWHILTCPSPDFFLAYHTIIRPWICLAGSIHGESMRWCSRRPALCIHARTNCIASPPLLNTYKSSECLGRKTIICERHTTSPQMQLLRTQSGYKSLAY